MRGLMIQKVAYWDEKRMNNAIRSFREQGEHSQLVAISVNREELSVSLLYYTDLNTSDLEYLFQEQTNARDPFLTMPGAGRLGTTKVGTREYTRGMLDYDDDDGEEF